MFAFLFNLFVTINICLSSTINLKIFLDQRLLSRIDGRRGIFNPKRRGDFSIPHGMINFQLSKVIAFFCQTLVFKWRSVLGHNY